MKEFFVKFVERILYSDTVFEVVDKLIQESVCVFCDIEADVVKVCDVAEVRLGFYQSS